MISDQELDRRLRKLEQSYYVDLVKVAAAAFVAGIAACALLATWAGR